MEKVENIMVVFLSCKWDDTEVYCLTELAKITDDHLVKPFNFGLEDVNAKEVIEDAKRSKPGLKLLILVNNNKNITYYTRGVCLMHIAFEEICRTTGMFMNNTLEDAYCPEHDTMSMTMKKSCDKSVDNIKWLFLNQNIQCKPHINFKIN